MATTPNPITDKIKQVIALVEEEKAAQNALYQFKKARTLKTPLTPAELTQVTTTSKAQNARIVRLTTLINETLRAVEAKGVKLADNKFVPGFKAAWANPTSRSSMLKRASGLGLTADTQQKISWQVTAFKGDLTAAYGITSYDGLLKKLTEMAVKDSDAIREGTKAGKTLDAQESYMRTRYNLALPLPTTSATAKMADFSAGDAAVVGTYVLCLVNTATCFIILGLSLIWWIGMMDESLTSDDVARDTINNLTCQQLNQLSLADQKLLCDKLLDGVVWDDDEKALLKLFNCVPCDRLKQLVEQIGLRNLRGAIDGAEENQLQVRLNQCGIIATGDLDDDATRLLVNGMTNAAIAQKTDQELKALINNLISGYTNDPDEAAILKILRALPCARMKTVVNLVGLTKLIDEFQGPEKNTLFTVLRDCGVITFASWDDDATRKFISLSTCLTIVSLSNADIRELILNLFEGATFDEDEQAILRLIKCLPCARVKQILQMPGTKYANFDEEVDGSEWDQLKPILDNAQKNC